MKSIRLLPVVIAAALALLLFKGVGLLTTGGYVLTGTSVAVAAGAAPAEPAEGAAEGASPEGGETTIELPSEPTLEDESPTIDDVAPTLGGEASGEGAPKGEGESAEGTVAAEASGEESPAEGAPAAEGGEAEAATEGGEVPSLTEADPMAEGVPMVQNEEGAIVPLAAENGGSLTENIILERLSARRAELDTREEELNLRLQLVEAAEAQLEQRAAALAEVEARINALADQQKVAEEGQFAAIISMYQTMKPAEAAAIFDNLDMQVLAKVAQGMNPRKMAPILAKMNATRAQQLTIVLAAMEPAPAAAPAAAAPAGENLAQLPQIVGQ